MNINLFESYNKNLNERYTAEEQQEFEEAVEKIRTALQLLQETKPVIKKRKGSWRKI